MIAWATARFRRWRDRRATIHALMALDEWLLKDIGVRRGEIPAVVDRVLRAAPPAPTAVPQGLSREARTGVI